MLCQKTRHIFFIILLLFTCLKVAKAVVVPPHQAQDSVSKLLNRASKQIYDNLNGAVLDIEQAVVVAQSINSKPLLFQIHRTKGYIFEQNSRLPEAVAAYRSALELKEAVNDSSKIDIFMDWAIIHKKLGQYKIAQEYYGFALSIAQKKSDTQMISYAFNGLATLHSAIGDFEKAISYYHQAINVLTKDKQKRDLVAPYRNIALVYLKANNTILALSNAELSYNLALEVKDSADIAGSLETLGIIYAASGKPQKALEQNLEALRIIEKVGDKRILLDILIQTADVYMQLNELQKAEAFYKRCLDYKDLFDYILHPNFYHKLGNLYLKSNKTTDARAAFERSLRLATEGGFKDLIQKNNLALAHIFEQTGNFSEAYRCLEKARVYSDSLFNEEKARNITQAQFIFDVERSEKKYKDLQLQQSRFWLLASVLFFSFITFFLIYFLRQRGLNNKALLLKNEQTRLQNRRLEESNEILRQYAYASAHDLKEPLRSISSFTSLIKKKYITILPPEAGKYMDFVVTGVKRMENLLSALLEYSTIIAENNIDAEPTCINSVLKDVKRDLQHIITQKNAQIIFPAMSYSIRMTRLHITQLFQNLIANALKFSDRPPVITIAYHLNEEDFVIAIKDNGIGMDIEYGDKIFRLFQRLDKSPLYEGTGIGLTICKNIVEKYNGKIWFESKIGIGTTFFISLPLNLMDTNDLGIEELSLMRKDMVLD